jgi:putative membrane protein
MRALKALSLARKMNDPERIGATTLGHLGYGAAMGGLYAPLADNVPAPPAAKGAAFGLLVWAVSYLGLLPAMGIMEMPREQSVRRNVMMILAHIIWGVALGMAHHKRSE